MRKSRIYLLTLLVAAWATLSFTAEERDKPTLFLIGDSTVRNGQGDGRNGQWGWGSLIGNYFDAERIKVENKAMGGTSTRTYYNNPALWQRVLDRIRPGDYVMMQFGHNDSSPIVDTVRARGTIRGNGDEYQEVYNPLLKMNEMVYSYGFYLRRFVKNVHDKGGIAIICSPVPRNRWDGDKVKRSDYALWAEEAAKQSGALFIPLHDLVIAEYEALGKAEVDARFFDAKDATHTIREGAELNAKLIADYLLSHKELGMSKFISK